MRMMKLNLGCGNAYLQDYINLDIRREVRPDVVCDVAKGLPFSDDSFDEVRAADFLEHIPMGQPVVDTINEIWRVLKHGGKFNSLTPSTRGYGAFMDPYHVSFWNQNSFIYYCVDDYRGIYKIRAKFDEEIVRTHLTNSKFDIFHVEARLTCVKDGYR